MILVKNKKGQALVEFVIILPVLLLIVISMVDFGNLLYQKYQLEQNLEYVSDLYLANDTNALEQEKQRLNIKTEEDGKYIKLTIEKEAKLSSPILRRVLGENYVIATSRKLYQDENKIEETLPPSVSPDVIEEEEPNYEIGS